MNAAVPRHARGMTLIETMVAMAIGAFLIWGAIDVYANSKRNYASTESLARLEENARFALETLEPDLRMAGFWGLHSEGDRVDNPAGLAVSCGGADVTAWALNFARPVEVQDDTYALPCAAHSAPRAGSDVLVVRHASAETRAPDAGQVQARSTLMGSTLFADGAAAPPGTDVRDVVVNAYYVDEASSFVPNTPALRRLTLVKGAVVQDEELVPGVENLQVQYGIATTPGGPVTRYVDADHPALDPANPAYLPDARVVAVRLWMLVRAEEAADRAFTDTRTYTPIDADNGAIVPGSPGYPSGYRRIEVTRTYFLPNAH